MDLEVQLLHSLEELVVEFTPKPLMLDLTLLVKLSRDSRKTTPPTQESLLTTSETMLEILLVWELTFSDLLLNQLVLP